MSSLEYEMVTVEMETIMIMKKLKTKCKINFPDQVKVLNFQTEMAYRIKKKIK